MNGDVASALTPPPPGSIGSGGTDFIGGNEQQQAQTTTSAATTPSVPPPPAPVTATSPPQLEQLGGGGEQGIFTPKHADYLSYSENAQHGMNDLQKLMQSIYANARDPTRNPEIGHKLDTAPVSDYAPKAQLVSTEDPQTNVDGFNKLHGWATTFGLDPNTIVNPDGTVDGKYWDKGDNGWGVFGYNTRDPNLIGASLPVDVVKASIGDYTKDPAIISEVKNGNYKVAITNADGKTQVVKLVDTGPANWTGNLVDLTYGATKALKLSGKDMVDVQLIGPNGGTIPIKGFHPSTLTRRVQPAGEAPTREAETGRPEEETVGTGVADYFRKRGDTPIRYANDPRLTTVKAGDQSWQVHREAAPYFQGFLNELASQGAPVRSDGGWVYREKVGAKGISEHAYGGAIDVNQEGRNEVTPEFRKWIADHPGALQTAEKKWNIYGGERFGDLGHFEWGGVGTSGLLPPSIQEAETRKLAEAGKPAEAEEPTASDKELLDRHDALEPEQRRNLADHFNDKEMDQLNEALKTRTQYREAARMPKKVKQEFLEKPGLERPSGPETEYKPETT
jgi:hypothetical protein